jgi:hypothetical protein
MNPKILLAFVAGALLASGIVYLAVKPEPAAKPVAVVATPVKTDAAASAAEAPVAAAPESAAPAASETLPPEEPKPAPRKTEKVRTVKPSPVPVPRREVALVVTPAPVQQQAPAAPVPAPQESQPAPQPVQAPPPEPAPAPQPPAPPPSVTLQPGTLISVRIGETITTQKNQPGDTFLATLAQPLAGDGFVIAERGARLEGRIVESERAGKVKGVSHLTIELTKVTTSDGQHVRIKTVPFIQEGQTSKGTDAAKVGGGAALGAIIGAIAGGGKGAGIGAGVGGAAGAGDVILTRGKDAAIPVETKISFKLQEPITITEQAR